MSYEATTVAAKLRDSLAAHNAALVARQHRCYAVAHTQIELAYRLRLDAHTLDPEHDAPAWADEAGQTPNGKDTHDEMMRFYRQQLNLKETTDGQSEQPAAEPTAQPVIPEPVTANPAVAESEQLAAEQAQPQHSATARVAAKRLQRKARHG